MREPEKPPPKPNWAVAALNNHDYFVKKSSLNDYLNDYLNDGLEARIKKEFEACEAIRRNPYPGLTVYHGCVAANQVHASNPSSSGGT